MIEIKKLNKISDILNSEGGILTLYSNKNKDLYLESSLKDGTGTIFYSVTPAYLQDYLQSKLTLVEVYNSSDSFFIRHKYRKELKTYLKQDFISSLQCGEEFYKEIPDNMKSIDIEKKYG